MKRKVAAVLAGMAMTAVILTGCGGADSGGSKQETAAAEEKAEPEAAVEESAASEAAVTEEKEEPADAADKAAEPETKEEAAEPEETQAEAPEADEEAEAEEMAAEDFVADRSEVFAMFGNMTSGWNLGNCLDAHGAGNSNATETYWGNPKASQEMIDAVAAKGFNVIRIPITWAEHVGPAPDYTINPEWMDRVQEVVDYAMNRDVYVIIDTHHEPDYWMITEPAIGNIVKAELTAIWQQVSERFKDYNEKLIFEGMNEPRLKGSAKEWNGGTPEERELINEWNQAFVDTVRASGGNNASRLLIICPYGTSANMNAIKDLAIPADNHIAVAVHMYTPYEFTYVQAVKGKDLSVWDGSARASIANTVKYLKQTLIEKGVPVIITEYGAENKENREEINKWVADYIGFMTKAGIRCIWWDNGTYNTEGEKFAIFNRKECTWYAESTADAIIAAAMAEE